MHAQQVGTIRLIDPSLPAANLMSHSTNVESRITFDQPGQPGAPGAPGPPGAPGAPGKDGTNGVSATVSHLAAGDAHCGTGGAAITDAQGSTAYICNGADGTNGQSFSGTFTSPNGQFSIAVADDGITLSAPANTIKLDAGGAISLTADTSLAMQAGASASLNAGTSLSLKASGSALLQAGGVLNLKGSQINEN